MARPETRTTLTDNRIYTYPDSLGQKIAGDHHYMIIEAFESNVVDGFASDDQPNLSVALYIPPGALKTQYQSKYDTFEGYSGVMNLAKQTLAGVKTADEVQTKMMSSFTDTLSDTEQLTQLQDDVAYIGAKKAVDSSDIARAAAVGSGIALNPYMSVYFSGPGQFRTFSFSFDFIPRREKESETIKNIVNNLKQRMLPGKLTQETHSYFLTYPDQFKIEFYINGSAQGADSSIFKIGRCVLTDLAVDYGGQGTNVFFNDTQNPFNVKLELQFQELDILTRERAQEGY